MSAELFGVRIALGHGDIPSLVNHAKEHLHLPRPASRLGRNAYKLRLCAGGGRLITICTNYIHMRVKSKCELAVHKLWLI